jgi:predicted metalloprotease with PDZ domain
MIHYQISCLNPTSQFIQIGLILDVLDEKPISLQLPAWRAGRYQLANYAQNIRGFRVFDGKKKSVTFKKTSKDRWEIFPASTGKIQIEYEYWAGKMDAGSAWVDDEQVYVNLVNCCFEVSGRSEEQIEITLNLPDFPKRVSTLIPNTYSSWKAENFQMLADSTILAAKNLTHWDYKVGETVFHCWFHGEIHFDKTLFLENFKAFSEKLIHDFGDFPEPEYQFIFQLLPYPHYHGVEHRRGTVITFGPAESLQDPAQMEELLGISCHELYHAWNVCRIRPEELLPYDFSKETYTQAGLILEGVTTYMGDLYLFKSGVYDLATYLRHFEKILNREAMSWGWKNNNILESSFDLWLDGYVPGIPDRKVNIYTRGALLAFCMDVILIKNGSSLTGLMRKMWKKFGKPFIGYRLEDFERMIVEEALEQRLIRDFLEDLVYGYQDLFPLLQIFFGEIGIQMEGRFGDDWLLHELGVRTNPEGVISQLHPKSQAFSILMKNDRIVNWPINKPEGDLPLKVQIERYGRLLELSLSLENGKFYPLYHLSPQAPTALSANWRA